MSAPLLVELFDRLPEFRSTDDEDLWAAGVQEAMRGFRAAVRERYTEGTLQRLLAAADDAKVRRAAALALGLTGTLDSAPVAAEALHDDDALVRRFAADALWELWFRGGTVEQNVRLREAAGEPNMIKARADLDNLIREATRVRRGAQPAGHLVLQARRLRPVGGRLRSGVAAEPAPLRGRRRAGPVPGSSSTARAPRCGPSAKRSPSAPDLDLHDTVRALEECEEE